MNGQKTNLHKKECNLYGTALTHELGDYDFNKIMNWHSSSTANLITAIVEEVRGKERPEQAFGILPYPLDKNIGYNETLEEVAVLLEQVKKDL